MPAQLLPITALLFSTLLMLMAGGLAGLLLPIRAGMEGWSTITIGWMGTFYSLAFTAGCLVVPIFVRNVGHVRVFTVLLTILGMSLLLHSLIIDPIAWMAFRGLAGFSLAGGYMVVESWLNERVNNDSRGMIFSVYMITTMVGTMSGQYILPFGDPSTQTLFIICTLIYSFALIPTALSRAESPKPLTQVSLDIKGLYKRSPAAVVGSLVSGIIAGAWNILAPIYGQMNGLDNLSIATMLVTAMIGGAIFQYPLGRFSDFVDRRYVMVLSGIIGVILSLVLMLFSPADGLSGYMVIFLMGAVLFPIYSLNVAHANDYAEANEFVKISGGLLIVYGIGNVIGPQIAARMMESFGKTGMPVTLIICFAAYGLHALWRISLHERPAISDQKTEFKYQATKNINTPESYQMDPRSDVPEEETEETPTEDSSTENIKD
ncbi:MFS family permease [Pseudochrobactrum saccharolyticum]|uniref:MFS family permease n=1 Tax=Pseudochrobactrum saccharolyticum TaxID=354352 RepID=A0A7W8AFN1_9HYPH|nr:MFS transporter [Pseudochrobactrum saccharolyticum]KAB0540031.1 MFS transporter [Pseudochrobactrum saccharolyticum]MBB5089502.1 MFS family permease [Pseudochrobactrum saccharolyticum]